MTRSKIYCDVYKLKPQKNVTIYINGKKVEQCLAGAEVYKIDIYNVGGTIAKTLQDEGNAN